MKKRIIAAMMTAAAIFVMAGCGGQKDPAAGAAGAATTQEASSEVAAELEWQVEPTAYLSGINAADYVELPADYAALTVEVEPVKEVTDEDVAAKIEEVRENRKELKEVSGRTTVEDGDTVNIDYVGRINGEEFAGGSDSGYDLTIGSGSFIDNFEDQLIGTHPGDKVTVNVTFPDPYENNPDYAGKAASFAVTVKGIYQTTEFNDEFVKKNLSSYAETAEAYKQYLKDTNYDNKLSTAIDTYIKDNISADKYPDAYLKHLQSLQMTIDEEEYNYMAQMYAAYGMNFQYTSVMEYKGASTEDAYQDILKSEAENSCLNNMAYQDLAAQAGITVTDDQYNNYITENEVSDEVVEQYGKPYIIQQYILPNLVKDYIKEHVTVE